MKLLRIVIVLLLSFIFRAEASINGAAAFDSANTQYAAGNFEKAASLYESILSEGYESYEVYFNLGNAYFKTNRIGLAILNYEKAKKLNGADEDITANLKLANQKIVDKLDVLPELMITTMLAEGFASPAKEKSYSFTVLVLFFLFCAGITAYFFVGSSVLKRVFFFSSLLLLVIAIPFFFMAASSYKKLNETNQGIVLSQSITAKGSPTENGTKLFVLHEGTKVKVQSYNASWVEVKLPNGDVGWIPKSALGLF